MKRNLRGLVVLSLTGLCIISGCGKSISTSETSETPSQAASVANEVQTLSSDSSKSSVTAKAGEVTDVSIGSNGLPSVKGNFGDSPKLEWSGSEAPATLIRSTLVEGNGETVLEDSTVKVNYHGQVWDSNKVFDSSFARGQATAFGLNQVIKGWKFGITGVKTGSRVLLSVPPELGYGPSGTPDGRIPPNATLVFVVDVLEVIPPAPNAGQADAVKTDAEIPVEISGNLGQPITNLTVKPGASGADTPKLLVLARGTGAEINKADSQGKTVVLHMASTPADGNGFRSTWQYGQPESIPVTNLLEAFPEIEGVTVGSRVFISEKSGANKLVYLVIDILQLY